MSALKSFAICALFLATSRISAAQSSSAPSISQRAQKSQCANIIALAGNINLKCSSLTVEQRKLLEKVPQMLKKILDDQLDPAAVMAKLDEIANQKAVQSVYAPNGIGSIGGTLVNPTVNNFGPAPAHLSFTEEPLPSTFVDGKELKEMNVHIHTDRSIPGAVVGIILSGPIDLTPAFFHAHEPEQIGAGMSMVGLTAPLSSGGQPIPNSVALHVNAPSAFDPGVDLIYHVQSTSEVHVLQVVDLRH